MDHRAEQQTSGHALFKQGWCVCVCVCGDFISQFLFGFLFLKANEQRSNPKHLCPASNNHFLLLTLTHIWLLETGEKGLPGLYSNSRALLLVAPLSSAFLVFL